MLHELDPTFMEHSEPSSQPTRLPAIRATQDWAEVRLWRRVKRAVLIERRLAMPAAERAVRSEAITAALAKALPSCPGTLIGFYWPFKDEYDPRTLARSLHAKGARLALPVVGFDRQGYRLGYGGGYYDRTLAAMPAKSRAVGVGFELSQIATIYPQPHDIAMNLIVTDVDRRGRLAHPQT